MQGACAALDLGVLIGIGCAEVQRRISDEANLLYVSINDGDMFAQKVKRAGNDYQPRKVWLT